ncbi:MAG: glycerol-3-phosphate 1-O-acyltransferase PlsY [Flavobacteriales bacterium]|nr:glycerol-3-phosphate 1-O-acyltransferase PlsY [Flavobacteriales bacterium]
MTGLFIAFLVLSYLIGSIPTAVWVGKAFYKKDVRDFGSNNAGATNTFRVLGVKAGIPVLLIDVLKGWFCAYMLAWQLHPSFLSNPAVNTQVAFGVAAIVGHIYPIFAGFRGGKGVATALGIIIALHVEASLSCFVVFIVMLLITRIVSLSSMVAAITFPLFVCFVFPESYNSLVIFSIVMSVLILATHIKNIQRLLKGEEKKIF